MSGAVLVRDGVAYFAAGRSSYLDGGIYVQGVDVATGERRYMYRCLGPYEDAGLTEDNPSPGFVMPGALPDVLVSDGSNIYMRHLMFDPELRESKDMQPNFYPARALTGEEFGGDHKYWCDLYESGKRAFVGKPEWYFRSYFNNFPGERLYSTTGLLDDSWHIRSYWSYGQIVGQQIVFDGDEGFAVRAFPNAARWLWYEAGEGYEVYAGDTKPKPAKDESLFALKDEEHLWTTKASIRPQAFILADKMLYLAGPPDKSNPVEELAGLEGKYGAELWALSRETGEKMGTLHIDALPVFDGMAAAGGRVYIATKSGTVLCLEGGAQAQLAAR